MQGGYHPPRLRPPLFARLAAIEGVAVGMRQGANSRFVEHALQAAIAAGWPSERAHFAQLAQDVRDAGG